MDKEARDEKIFELREKGCTMLQIAKIVGCHRKTVGRVLDPEQRKQYNATALRRQKAQYHNDPAYREKLLAAERQRTQRNPDRRLAYNREYYRRQRGIDATQAEMDAAYTGYCDICGIAESECRRRLSRDHCHTTQEFRGWLCDRCNMGLGCLNDNAGGILAYLFPNHAQILLKALSQ